MKVEVNFKKKYFYFLFSLVILFGGIFLISAYASPVTGVGHDPSEIDWSQIISSMKITSLTLNGVTKTAWPTGGSSTCISPSYDPLVTPGITGLNVQQVVANRGGNAGAETMCVRLDNGQVKCTGANTEGQLGLGTDLTERQMFNLVVDLHGVTNLVDMGRLSYCAILNSSYAGSGNPSYTGGLKCWGYNGFGNLGIGSTLRSNHPQSVIETGGNVLDNVIQVEGNVINNNYEYSCALTSDATGNLYCWGYNGNGQLGVGDFDSRTRATQLTFFNSLSVKNISVAGYDSGGYTCAIVGSNREVYCWGYNGNGQLGIGDTTRRETPVQVPGITDVKEIETISDIGTTCAIVGTNRELYCWGYNGRGDVGIGTISQSETLPRQVSGLINVAKVKMYGTGSEVSICALESDGELYCWGYGGNGQLGSADYLDKTIPTRVVGISNVKDVDGWSYYVYGTTCAIVGDAREVYCWGYNGNGLVGQGVGGATQYNTPQKVIGLEGLISNSISCGGGSGGGGHCAVLLNDNSIKVWGYNNQGQLGLNETSTAQTVAVSPL